jgi:hypothetical protein
MAMEVCYHYSHRGQSFPEREFEWEDSSAQSGTRMHKVGAGRHPSARQDVGAEGRVVVVPQTILLPDDRDEQ